MAPLTEFHYFVKLPLEIQLEIWGFHFCTLLRPRAHRITRIIRRSPDLSLLELGIAVDNILDRRISSSDRNITPESQAAARWVDRSRGTLEPIATDIAHNIMDYFEAQNNLPQREVAFNLFDRFLATPPNHTRIDWAEDLLYLELPNTSSHFPFLVNRERPTPWIGKIQRLALYLDERSIFKILGEHFWPPEDAALFQSLREVTLVMDHPPLIGNTATTSIIDHFLSLDSVFWASDAQVNRGRDNYGLIYVRGVTVHDLFQTRFAQLRFRNICRLFHSRWRWPLFRQHNQNIELRVAYLDPALGGGGT